MGVSTGSVKGAERVLAALCARREELIEGYVETIVPGVDSSRLGDMREAAELAIDALLGAMNEGRTLTREDVRFAKPFFRHAMLRGANEADLLRACRQSQRVMWDALSELAGPSAPGRAIVAELSRPLIDHVDAFSEIAAETFEEVQEAMSSTRRHAQRELVEDLLAGQVPSAGTKVDALRGSGLDRSPTLVVLTAVPVTPIEDEAAMTVAAAVLSRAPGDSVEPLVAVRDQEIVMVRAMRDDADRLIDAVNEGRRRLKADKITLAIGVSATHHGLEQVRAAYDEAWLARDRVASVGGLLALTTMTAFDYLMLRGGDTTAWNLVPAQIRMFIETDADQAGLLIDTLMSYIECNLNAKLAAEKLFIHHNTVHYRLAKIAELTGCDLRCQSDLLQLVVAVRLARCD